MASMTERMIGAAKLNAQTYEEVEADQTATAQAMAVVVISSLAAGIGTVGSGGLRGLAVGAIAALIGWFIWAGVIYLVGVKLMPEPQTQSDMGELLRTIGFSASPGVLRIVGFIPFLGWFIALGVSLWMLVAMVVAVRQALDYKSTGRAIVVCLIGFLMQWVVLAGLLIAFNVNLS